MHTPDITQHQSFTCPKCHSAEYETDEVRTTGKWSRFFDMQNKKFIAITCKTCGFTELYKTKSGSLGNVFDFFTGG